MMIEDEDNRILAEKGISQEAFERQLKQFETGFPFMKVKKAAVPSDGIVKIDEKGQSTYLKEWKEYLTQNKKIVKFVPAIFFL